jgi:uncharacterized membrane protein
MDTKPDQSKYKWGIFYFNPDDENLIAPKANSLFGWTLNFAKPLAYIFMLILLLIIMLIKRLLH